jgi:hypothetical protein
MLIDDAICLQVHMIGLGLVPPTVKENKIHVWMDSQHCYVSYAGVDVGKELSALTPEESLAAKRKFRKLFRKACEWKLRRLLQDCDFETVRAKVKQWPARRRERIKERFNRRVEAFKRSVAIDKSHTRISTYKMRNRKDLVIYYLTEELIYAK